MSGQSESHSEWKVEPARGRRDWWAAGYIYRGTPGTHQGQFVPVFHAPNIGEAGVFVDAMKLGCSRAEAKEQARLFASGGA